LRAGFPHSDICGSMLVCQLPAAFRRLPRPSSPVIAKASTTCTLSLDPITVRPRQTNVQPQVLALRLRAPQALLYARSASMQSYKPSRSNRTPPIQRHTSPPNRPRTIQSLYFFHVVKEQPISLTRNQKSENRLALCPLTSALCNVELIGIEPTTPCLQSRCSPS
jgi:hypothetical protein